MWRLGNIRTGSLRLTRHEFFTKYKLNLTLKCFKFPIIDDFMKPSTNY
jgi:hypothetical protein